MVAKTKTQSKSQRSSPPNTKVDSTEKTAQSTPPYHADLRWLWRFTTPHRRNMAGAVGCGVVGGIASAAEPFLAGVIIDHLIDGAPMWRIANEVLLMLAIAVVGVVAFWGQRYFSGVVAYSVNYEIRNALFDHLLTLDQRFFHQYSSGDLISRMHSDLDTVWRLYLMGLTRSGSAITAVVMTFVLLAMINLPLTLAVFVVLTISTALQMMVGLLLAPVFEKVQDQGGSVAALVQDAVSGIQTVKTFGAEDGVAHAFLNENQEFRRRWLHFKRRNEPVGMLPNMISQSTVGLVVLFGGILVVENTMTLGNFTQFLINLALISNALLHIGMIYQRLQQTRGALRRISPLLQDAQIRSKPDAKPLYQPNGDITFDQVSLTLEGTPILQDVSLHIPAGKVVAFVGPTGCGKTMLVNLLARVLDPTDGRILIDQQDVRDLELETLRRAIAYVPQTTFLFSQPLHENVRMGQPDFRADALDRAIHISRVSNDLPQLPHGLDTLVGEKGVMLSGGQKQRVAIARAIIRDPAILVLDDALSSVDTQTAADILHDLRGVLTTRTSLIIAHRVATVKDADLIVVMEDGRIVEQGTHLSLLAAHGAYARMVERELREDTALTAEN